LRNLLIDWLDAGCIFAVGGGGMYCRRNDQQSAGANRLIGGSLLFALLPLYSIFFLMPGSLSNFTAVMLAGALIRT
jgi:hypothetical protein